MPVGLVLVLALESYKYYNRKYQKRQAIKYNYDDEILAKDELGRPIDKVSRRRLTRNEARAYATHQRQIKEDQRKEAEWRMKGNILPNYGQARSYSMDSGMSRSVSSSSDSSSSSSIGPGLELPSQEDELQEWKKWSVSGAPIYTERDDQVASTA